MPKTSSNLKFSFLNIAVTYIKRLCLQDDQVEIKDQAKERNTKCVICLDKPLLIALKPCGHVCACHKCAKKLPVHGECPICRTVITGTLKVYFP